MHACILVAVEENAGDVAKTIAAYPGVLDAFPVLGRHEVVARCRVHDLTRLRRLLDRVTATAGVLVSETLLEIPQVGPA